jgi:pimeloyl-ACP methyl ester carboxylesterase
MQNRIEKYSSSFFCLPFVSSCLRGSILLSSAISAGCSRLSPGSIRAIDPQPQVCLIRGFLDWYSTGMDRLNDELQSSGVHATVYREEQWKDVADALLANRPPSILLVGFSYGADDVVSISRRLGENHLPVLLLITIDPVTPDAVPSNVVRCVNFYEPDGFWDIFPWLRGVPLHRDGNIPAGLENIDIRRRLDLVEPNTSHGTIATNERVHRAIIDLILQTRDAKSAHAP